MSKSRACVKITPPFEGRSIPSSCSIRSVFVPVCPSFVLFLLYVVSAFAGEVIQIVPTTNEADAVMQHLEQASETTDAGKAPAIRGLYREALACIQVGDDEKAVRILEMVIDQNPTLHDAWERLGWLYYNHERRDDALALWRSLRLIDPELPLPCNLLARVAIRENRLPDAIRLLEKSLEIDPDQDQIAYDLARVYRWDGQVHQAVAMLRKIQAREPERQDIELELARSLTENWNYAEAMPLWSSLRIKEPDNVEYAAYEALCQLHAGDLTNALERLEAVLDREPDQPIALQAMASAYEYSDRPLKAKHYLRRLMEIEEDPFYQEMLRVRLIHLLIRFYREDPLEYTLEEPIQLTRDRLTYDPESIDAHLLLGELLLMDGLFDQAAAQFQKVLHEINPYNLRAFKGLFETWLAAKKIKQAEEAYAGIAAFNPKNPYLYYYQARLEATRGRFFKAFEALDVLEQAGRKGAVACLLYHGLTSSPFFVDALYTERFKDQLLALRQAGFTFVRATDLAGLLDGSQPMDPGVIHVLIDFDDGRRDTMKYGTAIARELNMVFSMHLPVGYIEQRNPFICTWEQLRDYAATGCWEYGSHFYNAAILTAIDASGRLGRSLPNRIFLEKMQAMETTEQYLERLQWEFGTSRAELQAKLGGAIDFISYPFGDLGQEGVSNVEQPVANILAVGAKHYAVGFLQSPFGYAVAGDNPMLYQRFEIERWKTGQDLIDHIYRQHPVYLARRMRAEFAAQQGKLYLALSNIRELEQSDYPEGPLGEVKRYVHERLSRKIVAKAADGSQVGKSVMSLSARKPYVGVEGLYFEDNQDRSMWHVGGYGGLHLTPQLQVEASAAWGELKQVTTTNRTVTTGVGNAARTRVESVRENVNVRQRSVALEGTYTFPNGIYMSANLGRRAFSGDASYSMLAYGLETQIRPIMPLDVQLRFQHDWTPTALAVVREIERNEFMGAGVYRVRDWWDLKALGAHYDFNDDNKRDHIRLATHWTVWPRTGMNLGLGYAYNSADRDREAYWTPYELHRFYVEGGFVGQVRRSYYKFNLRYGLGRESVRPEADEVYRELVRRAAREQFDPGAAPEEDWEPILGAAASTKIPFGKNWEMRLRGSFNKIPNYNEFCTEGGMRYMF